MKKILLLFLSFSPLTFAADTALAKPSITPSRFLEEFIDDVTLKDIEEKSNEVDTALLAEAQKGSLPHMHTLAEHFLKEDGAIDYPSVLGLYWYAKVATAEHCPQDSKQFVQEKFDFKWRQISGLAELFLSMNLRPEKKHEAFQWLKAWQRKHMPNLSKNEKP